jgi:hypothetical protein
MDQCSRGRYRARPCTLRVTLHQARRFGIYMRAGKIRRWMAVAAFVGAGSGAVAFAQSPGDDLGDRRALEESCRSYVASPREAASERCAEALRSGQLGGVDYGPVER